MDNLKITAKELEDFTETAKADKVKQHYEEILTSLDYTFGEIKEQAEKILKPDHPYDAAMKRAANIVGLIDARSKY